MSLEDLLDELVTVERATEQRSQSGVSARLYSALATGVPAAIAVPSGGLVLADFGKHQVERWRAYFQVGTDVKEGDRIVRAGERYEVTLVETRRAHHVEAELRRVDVGT